MVEVGDQAKKLQGIADSELKALKTRFESEIEFVGTGTTAQKADAVFLTKAASPVAKAGESTALGEGELVTVLYATKRIIQPPFDMDAFADFYERIDVVGAAIDLIVNNEVGMGHQIIPREQPQGGSDVTPAARNGEPSKRQRDHCRQVFDLPNEKNEMFTEVMAAFLVDYYTLGQGYLEITRDAQNHINNIYHLPARTMRIRVDRDGRLEGYTQIVGQKTQNYRIFGDKGRRWTDLTPVQASEDWSGDNKKLLEKATIKLPGEHYDEVSVTKAAEEDTTQLNEVLAVHRRSPRRGLYGVPPLSAVFEDCVGLMNYKIFNADYFENSTIPPGIILVKGSILAATTRRQLKQFLETEGRQEYHKMAILSADEDTTVEFIALADVQRSEGSFIDYGEKCQKNIAMRINVPFSMLTEARQRAPGQAEQDSIRMREQVIRPGQRWLVGKMQLLLDDMKVTDWELKLLEGDLTEITARARAAEALARRGHISPDESRAWVNNWPPLPDGAGEKPFVVIAGQRAVTPDTIMLMNELIAEKLRSGQLTVADVPQAMTLQDGKNGKGNPEDVVRAAVERAGIDIDEDDVILLVGSFEEVMG